MRRSIRTAAAPLLAVISTLSAHAQDAHLRQPGRNDGGIAVLNHCDVIVSDLTGPSNFNTATGPTSDYVRYSFGTVACNIGGEPMDWYGFGTPDPTRHPVIAQNLYRLVDGRLEQIGLSWLKHPECALQQSACQACTPLLCKSGCCTQLGRGCSDPSPSPSNGDPLTLGPRSQFDASTGTILIWPYAHPAQRSINANDNGQIHARVTDIDPELNPRAIYIAEAQYVSLEETAGIGNHFNNASSRAVTVAPSTGFPLTYAGPTAVGLTALEYWRSLDPTVTLTEVDISVDGRLIVGCRANSVGDGWWSYEYAIYNFDSDRAVQKVTVPLSECVQVRDIGFHDVDYHSGDGAVIGTNYDSDDWSHLRAAQSLSWQTKTIDESINANALRWGTLYNFRFEANAPPTQGVITLTPFKAGAPATVAATVSVPEAARPASCPADVDPNGVVDVDDLIRVILDWGSQHTPADCAPPPCGNGQVDVDDLILLILHWGRCPPG